MRVNPASVEATDRSGCVPLHLACEARSSLEVIQCLVSAFPESLEATDFAGYLPLHHACQYGERMLEVIRFLVEKYPQGVKVRDGRGRLALHLSVSTPLKSLGIVNILVAKWPESVQAANTVGALPLHLACAGCAKLEVVQFLVEQDRAGLEKTEITGRVPLHIAVLTAGTRLEVIQYLVSECLQSLHAADKYGLLPLHLACKNGATRDVVQFLAEHNIPGLRITDKSGSNPLHLAAQRRHVSLGVIQYLVTAWNEGVQAINNEGMLPLHLACKNGAALKVVQLLLGKYPEGVKVLDAHGCLPLHLICFMSDDAPQILRCLISEQLVLDDGFVLNDKRVRRWTEDEECMQNLCELLMERSEVLKHVELGGEGTFTRDSWDALRTGLAALSRLETLKLDKVKFFQDRRNITRVQNCLPEDNFLDEILERNKSSLVSLILCGFGSALTVAGATALYELHESVNLRAVDLDLDMTYEMLRGRPDLWFCW